MLIGKRDFHAEPRRAQRKIEDYEERENPGDIAGK